MIMLIVTIYALIGDDIRILSFNKDHDSVFLLLNVVSFSLFMIELIFSSIGVKNYFGSFFFWLDLLSTLSIVTDIEPLWAAIISIGGSEDDAITVDELRKQHSTLTD
jgi:hypothetical protein